MNILVINAGSSSLKYQLFNMKTEEVVAKGLCERIGIDGKYTYQGAGDKVKGDHAMATHSDAIAFVIKMLTDETYGVIKSLKEIDAVGHRVLHGGAEFSESVVVNDAVIAAIKKCIPLGPLHNPANLMGIEACEKAMPGVPQVAVFDTAFHATMPEKAYMYGIPYEYYEKHAIRRYGFHGTSHRFVSAKVAEVLKKDAKELRIVTCHLGNGSSMAAVKGGKCVDTTMGLTPLEGPLMGTRSGSIDPAIVGFLSETENMTASEVVNMLNKKSGVLGVSGISSDFRDLEEATNNGNHRAQLALDMFAYQVKKYIGSYAVAMGGVDAIVFTAGVGENSNTVRKMVCENMEFMGIKIDEAKNDVRGTVDITAEGSKVKVLVIPTNEELVIASDTMELAK